MSDRPPLQARGFRLSPQQERLWRRAPAHGTVFMARALVDIDGPLASDRLEAAVRDVIAEREILRTTFPAPGEDADPAQVVHDACPWQLEVEDLDGVPSSDQREAVDRHLRGLRVEVDELGRLPLLRLVLVRLAPDRHQLLVGLPALCTDWVGLSNLVGAIGRRYGTDGREGGTPEVPQYADVAGWLHDLLESRAPGDAAPEVAGVPGGAGEAPVGLEIELPGERPGAAYTPADPRECPLSLGPESWATIRDLGRRHGTTDAVVLLTCWKILIWRLSGRPNVVVGTLYDGRPHAELRESLGPLAKFLPLSSELDSNTPFPELLSRVHDAFEVGRASQEFTEWTAAGRVSEGDGSDGVADDLYRPLCFELLHRAGPWQAGDVTFTIRRQAVRRVRFKLKLSCVAGPDGSSGSIHYDASRFDREDIERLAGQYAALLRSVVERPEAEIGALSVLSDAERERLIVSYNDTDAEYPREVCIQEILQEQVARTPDRVALAFGGEELTYAELDAGANRLARYLRSRGVGPDMLVGICLERSPEMLVAILGVLKAGGAYVPLDPSYPLERLAFMLDDTGASVVLTREALAGRLPEHEGVTVCLDREGAAIARESDATPEVVNEPQNLVYVIYTSGSTGTPKGVMITHRGLVISNCARSDRYREPVEKFLLLSSFSFDSSVVGIFWTLSRGGTLFLVPEELQRDLPALNETIGQARVSHLLTLPSYYALLLEHAEPGQLDCLRTVIVAGEPCHLSMVERHRSLLPNTELFSEYGATETTVFSSVYDCRHQTLDVAPIGEPISNARMYVLNSHLQPAPTGVPGEVYFGGEAISPGYWNRPKLNAERFLPDPFSDLPGARLYKSGDLARHLPDGDVEFLGRVDNQVKIRGFRIELEEIESVLAQCPGVREVVVAARAASEWRAGSEDGAASNGGSSPGALPDGKRLAAYLVAADRRAPTVGELREFVSERLPDYMMPAAFITLDDLPRHPNGKVDREALPAPGEVEPDREREAVAPRDPTEEKLAEIWCQVLQFDRVGIHDNFFELGGDSILSIQIVARANEAGLPLAAIQMFQHQTIAELAVEIGEARTITAEQGEVTGEVPLTPVHHWFCERRTPNRSHWNMSLLLRLARRVDPEVLRRAGGELLRHHDALRLRLVEIEDGELRWRERIAGYEGEMPVDVVDLSSVPASDRFAALERHATDFQAGLSITEGPLSRLVLFDLGDDESQRLLWVLHHLPGDIVSWRILLEDLERGVDRLERGDEVRLPAKTTSFRHWAERLQSYAHADEVLRELPYWRDERRAAVKPLPLDFADDGDANTEESTRVCTVSLEAEETAALLQRVPKAFKTHINEVLLTALAQSFERWTGESSLLVDVEGHGREDVFPDVDLSRTVGWFTSSFPVLLTLSDTDGPEEILKSVREQVRGVPNRGFGYGLLRYLHADARVRQELAELPCPEVNFNYLGQFGQAFRDSELFTLAPPSESFGPDRSPRGERSHPLEIVGWVVDDRLQVTWSYSRNLHRRDTIEGLANRFIEALRTLIASAGAAGEPLAGPRVGDPAEFGWESSDVDEIAEAIRRAKQAS